MVKSIKLTGSVRVGGSPLAKGYLTISSKKTPIDKLFPRSSPFLTDEKGRFTFYSIPGELDQTRIVVERADGNRILELKNIPSKPTPDGRLYKIQTEVDDYKFARHP